MFSPKHTARFSGLYAFPNFDITKTVCYNPFSERNQPMLIDIHAHIWGTFPNADKSKILKAMDRYHLTRVYVSALQKALSDEEGIAYLNDLVSDFMKEEPERIGGAVYLNPKNKNVIDVLKRAVQEQGFEMIKLLCCTLADDPAVDPIMEYAEENGIPVLLHALHKAVGQGKNESTGIHIANIARRHPKTKIIMAHLGGNCYNGLPAIRECKNIWCDNSGGSFYRGDDMDYAVELLGAERILFGTDMPVGCGANIGQIQEASLTEEQRELIFWKNAKRVLDRSFRL